jgi:hypothetical protein
MEKRLSQPAWALAELGENKSFQKKIILVKEN